MSQGEVLDVLKSSGCRTLAGGRYKNLYWPNGCGSLRLQQLSNGAMFSESDAANILILSSSLRAHDLHSLARCRYTFRLLFFSRTATWLHLIQMTLPVPFTINPKQFRLDELAGELCHKRIGVMVGFSQEQISSAIKGTTAKCSTDIGMIVYVTVLKLAHTRGPLDREIWQEAESKLKTNIAARLGHAVA